MEGRIEQHAKLEKGDGSKGENGGKKEEMIWGGKLPCQDSLHQRSSHRLCDVCKRRIITPCRMEKT